MINTAAYSFVSQACPDKVDKLISLLEGIVGIGFAASPVIGSLIYESVGFSDTFYIVGAVLAPLPAPVLCLLPRKPSELARKSEEK